MSTATTTASPHAAAITGPRTEQAFQDLAGRVRGRGLVLGGAGLLVGVGLLGLTTPRAFYPAYLACYLFFLGFGLGSLGLLMIHHLTGGRWGFVIRRPLESAAGTLPLMALLFLPIVLGMKTLYPWTDPEVAREPAIAAKAGYLNVGFWLGRAVVFHVIWSGLAFLLRSNSNAQDNTNDPAPTCRSQALSAPGLIVLFLTVTFAMIDWAMSTDPAWYSTIYPVMIFTGMGLSALALTTATASELRAVPSLAPIAGDDPFHDLGNLLLAFVMLWAYMSFSQYLIIWMGNLAEEVPWYIRRSIGGWRWVAASLMIVHYFIPFLLLLMRDLKRDPSRLWRVAALVLVMQVINDVWLIVPSFTETAGMTRLGRLMALVCLVPSLLGVGGLWAAFYATNLRSRPLAPRRDPVMAEAFAQNQHGGGAH